MTDLTLEQAREMGTEALLAALAEALALADEGFRRACVAVAVLEEREVEMALLPAPYRHARAVAEGRLAPRAALTCGRYPHIVAALMGQPLHRQDALAGGLKVKVAYLDAGRVKFMPLSVYEMSREQLGLAFDDGEIVSADEQGAFLLKRAQAARERAEAAPGVRIHVDAETGDIVVGRTHIRVDDLKPALAALGYAVKPIYGKEGVKPAPVR